MNINDVSGALRAHWPWLLAGAWVGWWLVPLARIIPLKVLQLAHAPLREWQGPGGGLEQPVPLFRRIWVPVLNAFLWTFTAQVTNHPALPATLIWAGLASALLLLALIDWDSTLLPDLIVFPLAVGGLASSYAGFTSLSFYDSIVSATVVLGLIGGIALVYLRMKGASGVGGGDLKLLAALATWWGLTGLLYVLLCSSLITVVWYFVWRRFKELSSRAEWPFGPAIVAAALMWSLLTAYQSSRPNAEAHQRNGNKVQLLHRAE